MRQHERMIEGVGFHFHSRSERPELPSFEELRQMVAEVAYFNWINAGCPPDHDGFEFWVRAERDLFLGYERGGYKVHVCDLDDQHNKGHLRYWDMVLVTPDGQEKV